MAKAKHVTKYKNKINVRGKKIEIWPADMDVIQITDCPLTYLTQFNDIEFYHDKLKKRILELEKDQNSTHRFDIGGSKVRYVHEWGTPEAELINARATSFFCQAVGRTDAIINESWASISRQNEYLAAHSHNGSVASVVYMLDPGNGENKNGLDGRFAIVDPRAPGCCNLEPECVTMEISPDMNPGSIILFPSQLVHHVHPYTGTEPRITLAWNFTHGD